ncbi:MAG: glycosyltransferase, partial [Eubacterium sp.]|nr:glycosyltransferase [Eubacterium sp.]
MKIAMIGHKRIPSREGGIEIVVDKISTELVKRGNTVVAYNRKGHHVSGKKFESTENLKEYNGIRLKTVFTFQSSKLNAIVYSAIAAIKASFSHFDVVHFHAEGPAAMCFLPKLFGKRVIVTIHGLDWQRSKWGGFATKFLKFGEKTAAKYADEIIVLSKNVQNYFLDTYNRKTVYIPN